MRPPHVPEVVTDRLLHEAVLAGLEGRKDEILMVTPRHNVDDIQIVAGK